MASPNMIAKRTGGGIRRRIHPTRFGGAGVAAAADASSDIARDCHAPRRAGCNASSVGDDEGVPPQPRRRRDSLTSRVFTVAEKEAVPLRTIITTVLVVVVTGLLLVLAWWLRLELVLFLVAIYLTVVLAGPVAFLERRGLRRGSAT